VEAQGASLLVKIDDPNADTSSMKVHGLVGMLLAILSVLSPSLWGQGDDSAARSKILALENIWNQAESSKDLKALDEIFDNKLIYVDLDGTLMTKADFLSRVKVAKIAQVVTESMSVEIFGSTAIVTGVYRAAGVNKGRIVAMRGRFVDTWVHENSTWVCIAAQATPISDVR
jgi:ketosteroid isomerase-like protein